MNPSPVEYYFAPDNPEIEPLFKPLVFKQPSDLQIPIWRYLTLAKFISLLKTSALYFSRLDKLGDPFEGSLTQVQVQADAQSHPHFAVLSDTSPAMVHSRLENTLVCSWRMDESESVAMWQVYLKGANEGVAIRSTYQRLANCFPSFTGTQVERNPDGTDHQLFVRLGMVQYINFDTYTGPIENMCLLKRHAFEYEREVRAVILDRSFLGDPHPTRFPSGGDYVPVNLLTLVESVYTVPGTQQWVADVLESIIGKYGFNF